MPSCLVEPTSGAIPLQPIARSGLERWLAERDDRTQAWVRGTRFAADPGSWLMVPGPDGAPAMVLAGIAAETDLWALAGLPTALPDAVYRLAEEPAAEQAADFALGWALGSYRFSRYKAADRNPARLVWPAAADRGRVERTADATYLIRDLVNTPANDLGPAEFAEAAVKVARAHDAHVEVIVGDELLARDYPTIHAVGRASAQAPRLIDIGWGRPDAPKVTLVGKGVCFDSGGLDIKPAGPMLLMKKDMGGAAHALALGQMIMAAKLPVRLRVLIPAVENAISGNAFRPLDIIRTRRGLTVEIGNTDAEGRLILCDALAEATSEKPDLIIDFATLTGAARVALGPELPALFGNDDKVAEALLAAGQRTGDPLWRLPLWAPYLKLLRSQVADFNNVVDGGFAGSITAALFLEQFVSREVPWLHVDHYAWNAADRPGRPKGGEAQGLRACFALIAERYGS